jgi:hypothetical protein
MTLRGYFSGPREDGIPASSVARDEVSVPVPNSQDPVANLPLRERDQPTRRQRPLGDGHEMQPSTLASRQALSFVSKATSSIDQQLALIEMLIAVGPAVREQGALDDALRALGRMEEQFRTSVTNLVRACSDVGGSG